jgi:DNA-binding transcriptional ArsR family regulator
MANRVPERLDPALNPRRAVLLKALSHPPKLAVLSHRVHSYKPPIYRDMERSVGLPAALVSHHLDHRERAGLSLGERSGRGISSMVRGTRVADLSGLLTGCC